MPIHNVYKPIGWSSLDVIKQFRQAFPAFADSPITYTGRLDPMAEGVMVLLSNEDRHAKSAYQKKVKTYKATFLVGVQSDTYDCLGTIDVAPTISTPLSKQDVESFLLGEHHLPFPPYSSYRINGKPLHYWAQTHQLDAVKIPMKRMEVLKVCDTTVYTKPVQEICEDVMQRIRKVRGAFRQEATLKRWETFNPPTDTLTLIDCTLTVTSGTYIRALAHAFGNTYNAGCVLYALNRISVETHMASDSIHLPEFPSHL